MAIQLDETDRKLIALLRHDARAPVSTLAADLKLSRATIKSRIDRLVEKQIIQGLYCAFEVRRRDCPHQSRHAD